MGHFCTWCRGSSSWFKQVRILKNAILFDLCGHGNSKKKQLQTKLYLSALANDILEVLIFQN
jgi:hypothetical protein